MPWIWNNFSSPANSPRPNLSPNISLVISPFQAIFLQTTSPPPASHTECGKSHFISILKRQRKYSQRRVKYLFFIPLPFFTYISQLCQVVTRIFNPLYFSYTLPPHISLTIICKNTLTFTHVYTHKTSHARMDSWPTRQLYFYHRILLQELDWGLCRVSQLTH